MESVAQVVAVGAALALAGQWLRTPREAPFGFIGWAGLGLLAGCASIMVVSASEPAVVGALAWTGIVLAVDAAVLAARGKSLMRSRPEAFLWLVILSVFLWLPFEWYNVRLAGWYRSGFPPNLSRYLLLGWSFACIWPALFETADLLIALWFDRSHSNKLHRRPSPAVARCISAAGATLLLAPLAVPRLDLGEYMLPLASVGFLLLLEPWNCLGGRPSLWLDARSRSYSRLITLAGAGLLCGLWLDALNHFSHAKWHSLWSLASAGTPLGLPWAAYVVLPLFSWQAFSMYQFAVAIVGLPPCELGTPGGSRMEMPATVRPRASQQRL